MGRQQLSSNGKDQLGGERETFPRRLGRTVRRAGRASFALGIVAGSVGAGGNAGALLPEPASPGGEAEPIYTLIEAFESWKAPDADRQVLEHMRDTYGLADEEARRAVAASSFGEELADVVGARFLSSYAGTWIDFEAGGVLHLAVTDPKLRASLASTSAKLPFPIEVELARFTVAELDAMAGIVNGKFGIGGPRAGDLARSAAVMVDGPANRLTVQTQRGGEFEREVSELLAAPELRDFPIELELQATPVDFAGEACYSKGSCDPPLRGGISIQGDSNSDGSGDGGRCTAGFTAKRPVGGGYEYVLLSAGHCNRGAGINWKHNTSQLVGAEIGHQAWGYVDALAIRINDTNHWKPTNMIHRVGYNNFRITSKITAPGSSLWGNVICHEGINSWTCGSLLTHNLGWYTNTEFGAVAAPACPGDSGGPWFNASTSRAYGIHAAGTDGVLCPGPANEVSVFSWVPNVESFLGGTILTGDPGW